MRKDPTKMIIIIGFGCLLILMCIVTFISLTQMKTTIDDMSTVVEVTNSKMHSANTMRDKIRLRGETLQRMYLTKDFFAREEYRLYMFQYALEFKQAFDRFRSYSLSAAEREIVKRIMDYAPTAETLNNELIELMLEETDDAVLTSTIIEANNARRVMLSMLNELVMLQDKNAEMALMHSATYHEQTQTIVIILAVIAVMIGLLISSMVVREAARKNVEIQYQASHDTLTNLVNRKEFETRLNQTIESVKEKAESSILCFLDLDEFKPVNDTCGHDAGDELLRQITELISNKVRDRDTLGRLGGDEFGLLLERCSLEKAIEISKGIISVVRNYDFNWEGQTFNVGVSIGIVQLMGDSDATMALNQADIACYAAKDMGRNRAHVYETEDSDISASQRELGWISNIQNSIANNRFRLYVQPIIPINDTASAPMYEVLLRVIDDMGNTVSPGKYIPAAERFNLMREVDEWVFENVIRLLSEHSNYPTLCVNISNNSVVDKEFCEFAENTLYNHNIKKHQLCIELAEKAVIKNINQSAAFINALKKLHCDFSLDDFGSGMSSVNYLSNLSVDYLKINGDIVSKMVKGNTEHAMVAALDQAGKVMNIKTIAEHVETESALLQLKSIGVDYAQGYNISRPFPIEELDLQMIVRSNKIKSV